MSTYRSERWSPCILHVAARQDRAPSIAHPPILDCRKVYSHSPRFSLLGGVLASVPSPYARSVKYGERLAQQTNRVQERETNDGAVREKRG